MKLKYSILFIGLMLAGTVLFAQEQTEIKKYKHGIGAVAGFTTGYGLSYRFTPNRFGVQANFFLYTSEFTDHYVAGLTFLYTIIETGKANLFIYQSNSYDYVKEKRNFQYEDGEETFQHFNNGLGLGIEMIILKRIGLNIMGGYGAFDNFDRINFTVETGIFFKL